MVDSKNPCPWCPVMEKILAADVKIMCPSCGAKIKGG